MGDKTKISWTDASWNPLRGCSRPTWSIRDLDARFPSSAVEYKVNLKHKAGADPAEWPEDLRVQQFPTERGATP